VSRYDNTNIEKVASRDPDGDWACCLCTGWKNRECGHKDYKFNDQEIFLHLRDKHFISTRTLQQSNWMEREPIDVTLANALGNLMAAEGGEPGDKRDQRIAWKKAETALMKYEKGAK